MKRNGSEDKFHQKTFAKFEPNPAQFPPLLPFACPKMRCRFAFPRHWEKLKNPIDLSQANYLFQFYISLDENI